MIINLVKKDLLLAKKYLFFIAVFALVGPIFISTKIGLEDGSFISFLITLLFAEYILFNTVSLLENKYKGASLLSTTPYSRESVIKAKYFFILFIYLACFLLYNIAVMVGKSFSLHKLSIASAGTSLLVIAVFFGILIPLQIYLGYEKTRYVSFFLVFLTPFILPTVADRFQSSGVQKSIQLFMSIPEFIREWTPLGIAFVVGFISMQISIRIYSKKDL